MRKLVISDIHGCLKKLKQLLKNVNYDDKNDQLILLGDYVDRGPEPIETLLYVNKLVENGAIALMGNHDAMFKELLDSNGLIFALTQPYYEQQGCLITIKQFITASEENKKTIKNLLNKLKLYYEQDNYLFVHAGINVDIPIDKQPIENYYWIRDEFYKRKALDNKIIIFGHTPTCNLNKDNSCSVWIDEQYNDKIGIDCACVYGGNLSCLDITNNEIYYV